MKFTSTVGTLLLASTALAAPSPRMQQKMEERRHERLSKRLEARGLQRMGRTGLPLAVNHTSMDERIVIPPSSEVQYDSNWAGGVISTTGVTSVTGTFTVPTVKEPSGGNSNTEYGASAWVGIDGDTCQSAILQTGVEMLVEGSETAYSAWYEWFPDYSHTFSNFEVAPGDKIEATVHATSTTSGTAVIRNLNSGKSVTHTFSNEQSTGVLCQHDAEWIVEDFESGSSLVPFANFGSVTFTGASYTANGATKGVTGASILDVEQNGKVQTNCGASGSSSIYCNYEN